MPRAASEKDVAGVRKVAEGSCDKLPPIAVSASLPTVTNIGGGPEVLLEFLSDGLCFCSGV